MLVHQSCSAASSRRRLNSQQLQASGTSSPHESLPPKSFKFVMNTPDRLSSYDNSPTGALPNGREVLACEKPFKQRRSFEDRKRDVEEIIKKHPHKIPLVIERAVTEKSLPLLDKTKFLVPEELTMSQLTAIIRRRMNLHDTQSFYLIINRKSIASTTMTLLEIYRKLKDNDGFLYMTYASQEVFG